MHAGLPSMRTPETVLEEPLDPRSLRNALGRFATGVTIITTTQPDGKREGLTANSFAALSLDPPMVLWSLGNRASSLPGFLASGRFAINVLDSSQVSLAQHFAKPRVDKFEGIDVFEGLGRCPLMRCALASFECRTDRTLEAGDHWLFIGVIERARYRDGEALVFQAGRYGLATAMPSTLVGPEQDLGWGGLG